MFSILYSVVLGYVVSYCPVLFYVGFFERLSIHLFAAKYLNNRSFDFTDVRQSLSVSGVGCRLVSLISCVRVRVSRLVSLCFVVSGVSLRDCALISFVPDRLIAVRFLQWCVVFSSLVWRFARLFFDEHIALFTQIVLFTRLVS